MSKYYIHLDDRLIHGQILYAWCPYYKVSRIEVVSEKALQNDLQRTIMAMSVPDHISLYFSNVSQASKKLGNPAQDDVTMYLFDSVSELKQFYDALSEFDKVNIRNFCISNMSLDKSRQRIAPSVNLNQEEIQTLKALAEEGCISYFKRTPEDKA